MIATITHVVVVVPARNEETDLPACLDSIETAAAELTRVAEATHVRCIVVAHRSTDSTARIAGERVETVVLEHGNVGTARAAGFVHALSDVGAPLERVWLATTDADSTVPANWIVSQLEFARTGVDAVIGGVVPDLVQLDSSRARAWLERRRRGVNHEEIHGANLGMRASAYLKAGGFQPLSVAEDVDMVERLRQSGAVVTVSSAADVVTSSRLVSRTVGGYASWLRDRLVPAIDE